MCDVERPLHVVGRLVNAPYKALMRLSVVPNLEGDKHGLINTAFGRLSPILQRGQNLKSSNRSLYQVVKFALNSLLIAAAIAAITGVVYGVFQLADLIT
jgi:beta-hydroxylase